MSKLDDVKTAYLNKGISIDNIDYVIDAVKTGTKRQFILESLTEDYRGLTHEQALQLLEATYAAYGGEFKRENSTGYLFSALLFAIGIGCAIVMVVKYEGIAQLTAPGKGYFTLGAAVGLVGGTVNLIRAMRGKFRDNHIKF